MNSKVLVLVCLMALSSACEPSTEPLGQDTSPKSSSSTRVVDNLSEDFQQIAQQILPAVVSISVQNTTAQNPWQPGDPASPDEGVGSGVIVDAEKGYILTNNHVVEDSQKIWVTLQNQKRYQARVVGTDPPSDVAVVQLENPPSLTSAVLGNSDQLKVGEWVLAIGSPFGLDSTVTAGIISAKGRAEVGVADFEDFIQTDAAINPGNSGGALVNIQGELIGLNTAIATRTMGYMGIGFAIPSNMLKLVMQELISKGKVTRSQLGVYIGPLDDDLRSALKLSAQQQGIVVMDVIPGTPAAAAGFEKYDLIVALNGKAVSQVQAFRNEIALTAPGQSAEVSVQRKGQPLTLKPTLREMSADAAVPPGGKSLKTRLGFELEAVDEAQRQTLGLPPGVTGLVVTEIDAQSTAWKRGLRQGDVILEINRRPVRRLDEIDAALNGIQAGDAVLLQIFRQGETRILAFELP